MLETVERSTALRSAPRWSVIALALVIGIYGLLVVGAMRGRGALWHDEAVSVLEATGHADDWYRFEFERAAPYGEWATAADYQFFQSIDRPLDLAEVSRNLGQYDVHPPGFFWLEHVVLLLGVAPLWSGPVVNGLLGAVLGLAVFGLILRFSGNALAAVAVSASVLWSPAMLLAAAEARQYVLYALLLFALAAWGAVSVEGVHRGNRWGRWWIAGLVAVVAAGLLSNHQFLANAIIAVGLVSLLILPRWRTVWHIAGALLGGFAISWIVFPYFFTHLSRLNGWAPDFEPGLVAGRAARWVDGLLDMVTLSERLQGPGHAALRILIAMAFFALVIWIRTVWRWVLANRAISFVVLFAAASTVVPAVAYAAQRFLVFIEGGHYVAPLWPLLIVAVSLVLLSLWPERATTPLIAVSVSLLVSSTVWVASLMPNGDAVRGLIGTVASADALVVDCVSRGYFPTITEFLDPDTAVFAARGEDVVELIASGWVPAVGEDTYLLHAGCAGAPDVVQVIRDSDLGDPTLVGTLERLQVWRFPRR